MKTIVALGSNMGDRRGYIQRALEKIEERAGRVVSASDIIETRAYGLEEQDDFLNMVILLDTDLSPRDLLRCLNEIEAELERIRDIRWGPRTIDLDIIYYGDEIINEEDLIIPHQDLHNRRFVLEPLCQIAPDWKDPRSGKSAKELLEELKG